LAVAETGGSKGKQENEKDRLSFLGGDPKKQRSPAKFSARPREGRRPLEKSGKERGRRRHADSERDCHRMAGTQPKRPGARHEHRARSAARRIRRGCVL